MKRKGIFEKSIFLKKKPSGECPRVLKEEFEKENYRGINETAL